MNKQVFLMSHDLARARAVEAVKAAPEGKNKKARVYKPLSPEKQAKKNAALLAKRREAGVRPKKVLTNEEKKASSRARTAAYRERHKERLLYEALERLDEIKEKRRSWYQKNKKAVMESAKRWKLRNPDSVRIGLQNYRAKKRSNGGTLSKGIAVKLLNLQKRKCAACRVDISKAFHMDHIVSVAAGGQHCDSNIQLLCPHCNMSKQAQHPIDFMQKKGFLL